MHILTTSTDSQSIDVIPRRSVSGELLLFVRNESTNIVNEYTSEPKVWNTYEATFNGTEIEWQNDVITYTEGKYISNNK